MVSNWIKFFRPIISMHLLYSICVPKLIYAAEVRVHSAREMSRMDVALNVNDAIRKIFTFHRWESTRFLHRSFGYRSISEIFHQRYISFRAKLELTFNPVLLSLARVLL